MHVRNNLWEKDNHMSEFIQIWALFFGAIYTRWDLSLDSLFSYVISRAYFRQTSVIRVHPVLGPRLRLFVKIFYMKLKCNFKKFLLKKTYGMSRNCINWITAEIYGEIFAESLQVMNIEERIDLLSAHCHSYVLSVKAKIYS